MLYRLYDSERTLRFITLALSASMLAEKNGDAQLRIKGVQGYMEAIQEMAVALKSPKRSSSDGVLAAVRLLAFYEVRLSQS